MPSAAGYYALAATTLAVNLIVGLLPLAVREPRRIWALMSRRVVFFATAAVTLVAWRWPVILFTRPINPDESTFIALARVALVRHVPWRDFDATTSGPLNVWPLAATHVLGFGLTYATSRALTIALVLVAIFALHETMRRLFGEPTARISSLAAVCFFATASYQEDFTHYSSETIPILLSVLLGLTISLMSDERCRFPLPYAALAGALTAAMPLAKLQAVPLAAALGLVSLGVLLGRATDPVKKLTSIAAFVFGALAALATVMIPVLASGAWNDFLISYIREQLWYVKQSVLPPPLKRGTINLFGYPSFLLLTAFTVALPSLLLPALFRGRGSTSWFGVSTANLAAFASVALTLLASAYAVVVANEPWGEHLLLLVFPLCAFAGCAFALYVGFSGSVQLGSILASSLLTALVTLSAGAAITIGNPFLRGLQGEQLARRDTTIGAKPTESALLGRIPIGATLAVWGWNPEVFVLTQTISGTREAFTQFQMWPGPFEAYYIRRYVSDLERSKPEYFLDASRPFKSAWWTMPTRFQLSNFTAVAQYVAQHYVLVDRANGLKLYRRAEGLTH